MYTPIESVRGGLDFKKGGSTYRVGKRCKDGLVHS